MADLGGLKVAFDALQKTLAGKPRPPLINGFTPEQRFFLAFAQAYPFLTREAEQRHRAVIDPHSPARARINGPLANMPEFAEAFGCKVEGPMNRPAEVRPAIW